jgi:hypothetical protein
MTSKVDRGFGVGIVVVFDRDRGGFASAIILKICDSIWCGTTPDTSIVVEGWASVRSPAFIGSFGRVCRRGGSEEWEGDVVSNSWRISVF